jgi:hypothetical protein
VVIDRKLGVVLIAMTTAALFFFWPRQTPQVGADEEAYRTLDALFTAVTSRNHDRLTSTETRLRGLRDQGKLPAPAAEQVDAIIIVARNGDWQPAAERLYEFIKGQRR